MDNFNAKGMESTRAQVSGVSTSNFNSSSDNSNIQNDVTSKTDISAVVPSDYNCEDDLSSMCKEVTSTDGGILCWNQISELSSGNLPSIKEIQSHLFSSSNSNLTPPIIATDESEGKGVSLPSFPVSDATNAFQSSFQVVDSPSQGILNVTSTSISYSIPEVKIDQLNYMNILSCEPDLEGSEMEECPMPDTSIAAINQNVSTIPPNACSLLSEDKDASRSSMNVHSDEMITDKSHPLFMNFLTKVSHADAVNSSGTVYAYASESSNFVNLEPSARGSHADNDHEILSPRISCPTNLLSPDSILKIPEIKGGAAQEILNSLMSLPSTGSSSTNDSSIFLNAMSSPTSCSFDFESSKTLSSSITSTCSSMKTSALNQGSQTTTIVPSIKNIITCPVQACSLDSCSRRNQGISSGNVLSPEIISSKNEICDQEHSLIEQISCLKCKMCSFISLNKADVLKHIKDVHNKEAHQNSKPIEKNANIISNVPCDISKINTALQNNSSSEGSKNEAHSAQGTSKALTSQPGGISSGSQLKSNLGTEITLLPNQSFNLPTMESQLAAESFTRKAGDCIATTSGASFVMEPKSNEAMINLNNNLLKFLCPYCSNTSNSLQQFNAHLLHQHRVILNLKKTTCNAIRTVAEKTTAGNQEHSAASKTESPNCIPAITDNISLSQKNSSLSLSATNATILQDNSHKSNSLWPSARTKADGVLPSTSGPMVSSASKADEFVSENMHLENEMSPTSNSCDKFTQGLKCLLCYQVCSSLDHYSAHMLAKHQSSLDQANNSEKSASNLPVTTSIANQSDVIMTDLSQKSACETDKANLTAHSQATASLQTVETPSEFRKPHQARQKTKADGTFIADSQNKRTSNDISCDFRRCNLSFRQQVNLSYHKKVHIHDKNATGFCCPECQTRIELWKNMTTHLWRTHSIDMELHKCDFCDYKTWSHSQLHNSHRLIHGEARSFLCDICGKSFKNFKQMRNHKRIHTGKKKVRRSDTSYPCDACGRSFRHVRVLQMHREVVHEKIRPFLCNFCGYSASCNSSLKMHMRVHTGEKPYSCEQCNYKTSDHNSLRRHKMTHSGEKPYKCPYCSYACIQSNTYKAHLKLKHFGKEDGLLYSCDYCSFKTIRKEILSTHLNDHHVGAIPITKFSCLESNGNIDGSVSIALMPQNDGSVTLTSISKGTSIKVIEFVQIPDSGSIATPDMDTNLQTMVSTNICHELPLPSTIAVPTVCSTTPSLQTSADIRFEESVTKESPSSTLNSNSSTPQLLYF